MFLWFNMRAQSWEGDTLVCEGCGLLTTINPEYTALSQDGHIKVVSLTLSLELGNIGDIILIYRSHSLESSYTTIHRGNARRRIPFNESDKRCVRKLNI